MLLRFAVENFRSIASRQEILLTASTSLKDDESVLRESAAVKAKVLPVAAIYGANASGKSNLFKAMEFFKQEIVESHSRVSGQRPLGRQYFRLDKAKATAPSVFECDFVIPGSTAMYSAASEAGFTDIRFTYGFSITDHEVIEEWLYAYPKAYRQVWFHRKNDKDETYYFGKELKGRNKFIADSTRKDALYLSTAAANNHHQLSAIIDYFRYGLIFRLGLPEGAKSSMASYMVEKEELRKFIVKYLSNADIGICDAKVEDDVDSDEAKLVEAMRGLANTIRSVQPDADVPSFSDKDSKKKILLGHKCAEDTFFFEPEDESRGTLALLDLLGWILAALSIKATLIIDELDSSLHPILGRKIIEFMSSKKTNPFDAQLLFTTHDTSLLSGQVFRRDQIWFTEKNQGGETVIYPLSDMDVRKEDNLEKGYLLGRFGAVPFIGDFNF